MIEQFYSSLSQCGTQTVSKIKSIQPLPVCEMNYIVCPQTQVEETLLLTRLNP